MMRNMGVCELVLVDPVADPADREARKRSTHGEAILDRAQIVPDLATALRGCLAAVGTSARSGELIRAHAVPPAVCARRVAPLLAHGKVALVFGPEPSGLTNMSPAALARHGLDYESVAAKNPRVVYGIASAFGHVGPEAPLPGMDVVAQARSGLMQALGAELDGLPVHSEVQVADYAALAAPAGRRDDGAVRP